MTNIHPFVLIILDGFGFSEESEHNAIAAANKPNWDKLWQTCPHLLIQASGKSVGLPDGQMGNSEVGHLNIGAGRVVRQDSSRIEQAIQDGSFQENPVFLDAIDHAIKHHKKIHVLGLLSNGGVHSQESHLFECIKLAASRGSKQVYLHAFLDGRDSPPKSALPSLQKAEALFENLQCGNVASIVGRYYAMDRDHRWERTKIAYDLLTEANAVYQADCAVIALEQAYARGETDEFVKPTSINSKTIETGDCVIFMNYRADRTRQLTRAFLDKNFHHFDRAIHPIVNSFVSLTQYASDLPTQIAFKTDNPINTLGECIANLGLPQLKIAETEKYAHVTFFFNGGRETIFPLEERQLIPSPKIATYDLQPEMSANLLTDKLVKAIESKFYQLIVCNYANPDMVGHTGDFAATVKAIETIDACLGRVIDAVAKSQGQMMITADHGNAEMMFDPETGQAHTAHTILPVPLIYYGKPAKIAANSGALCDIAPTILSLLHFPIPAEMTGKVLIEQK